MAELTDRFVEGRKGAHVSGVLLTALGIFILISLATHSHLDAPNSSYFEDNTFNWGGRIGAYLSYGALTAIGYASFVWPLVALTWGWNRFVQRSARTEAVRSVGLVGFALIFCVASGLPAYSPYTAFQLGGWLGTQVSSKVLIPYAGRIGSVVLLGALFTVCLILATEMDPRRLAGVARGVVTGVGRSLRKGLARLGSAVVAIRRVRLPFRFRLPRKSAAAKEEVSGKAETPSRAGSLSRADARVNTGGNGSPSAVKDGPRAAAESTAAIPLGGDQAGAGQGQPDRPMIKISDFAPTPSQDSGNGGRKSRVPGAEGPDPADFRVDESPGTPGRNGRESAPANGRGPKYQIPDLSLLDATPGGGLTGGGEEVLMENARILEEALSNFDVHGKVVGVSPGPVVTRYEVEPASGVKVSRIVTLTDDLARIMSAEGIRIQAPVPGKSVVGVEIANKDRETVYLREILESPNFLKSDATLAMALGKTISGEPLVADLAKMPHLLVAGATGSGKSVCINSLISSILFKSTPDDVRLLMVDPKVVELTVYNGIPHLLVPVITEPKKASEALKWAVAEMESRYQLLAKLGVRNLADYNTKVTRLNDAADADEEGEEERPKTLPCIVILVDEFADLMLTAPADVETSLMSLAQKSRAVGIHIILATQRPSVNVITGVIKANFPSRIAFQVASKTDSRTILDMNGAERLLGKGDMLYLPGGQGEPIRIHGAFVSGEETERLVESIKEMNYDAEEVAVFFNRADINSEENDRDELFDVAVNVVAEFEQASTSFLQRRMKIGYSRAARLMDELELAGIVGPAEGAKPREILVQGYGDEEE